MSIQELRAFQLLTEPINKRLFKIVLGSRLVSRSEIESKEEGVPKEEVDEALLKLENAGLIEKRSFAINEFDKFYPTASGLGVENLDF
jgi:hypothetical protein